MYISMLGEDFCERKMLKDFYDIIKGFEDDIEGNIEKQPKLGSVQTADLPSNGIHDNTQSINKDISTQEVSTSTGAVKTEMVTSVSAPQQTTQQNSQNKENCEKPVVVPCRIPNCITSSSCEEERIAEYLNRSDTAVIYPEPVSDREEGAEEEEAEQDPSLLLEDEELVLRCAYCEQTFHRASILQDHLKSAHPEKPIRFLCPKCDENFHLKSHLDKHLALHSPTSQACKVCSKTFANVYRLQRHMISHNESSDLRKFKCPQCGKAFKFKHHLKEHVRIHSGEKPFECSNCHKRFSHSGSYSSHMTSKKCWIAGHHKGQGQSSLSDGTSPATYSASHAVTSSSMPPLSTIASTISSPRYMPNLPFMHFNPAAVSLHGIYSSPAGPLLPITAYSMVRPNTPLKTPVVVPHAKLTESPVTTKSSTTEATPQISPDVNCNTQLVSIQKTDETEADIKPDVKTAEKPQPVVKVEDTGSSNCKKEDVTEGSCHCKHCGEQFSSAVEQHQHERYLCKANRDIVPRVSYSDSSRNSPCSTVSDASHHDTPNGNLSAMETDGEEGEELYKEDASGDGKKFRMRSLINDEQLSVLKSYYQMNPRPRKYELIRIGNEIGFSKRVVQVWFQNMRARDRRQGKNVPYFPSMARFKRQESPSGPWKDPKAQTYIPLIPNPNMAHKVNNVPSMPKVKASEEQPLDLSVKPCKPPTAHSQQPSGPRHTPPTSAMETPHAALNLSFKPNDATKSLMPAPFNSPIYKYMQQEGLFGRQFLGHSMATSVPNMMHPIFGAHLYPRREHFMMNHQDQQPKPSTVPANEAHQKEAENRPHSNIETDGASSRNLVIDENGDDSSNLSSSDESDVDSHYAQMAHDAAMADATLNLATLAEVSLSHRAAALIDSNMKSKRLRKKSWRQMEAEEVQMDLEDSLLDEDHPLRKKRRSWKGHKVDSDEGMYACDQCKKMFSKQSSLARHKYEHSGARPFTCEICAKAFKHKHHLTEHRRLHSGEKPFVCNKCGKRFSHSGSYSQHMNHRYKYCKPMRNDDGFNSM